MSTCDEKRPFTAATEPQTMPETAAAKRQQGRVTKTRPGLKASLVPAVVKLTPTRIRGARFPRTRQRKIFSPGSVGGKAESPYKTSKARRFPKAAVGKGTTSELGKERTVSKASLSKQMQTCVVLNLTHPDRTETSDNLPSTTTSVEPQDSSSSASATENLHEDRRPEYTPPCRSTEHKGHRGEPSGDSGGLTGAAQLSEAGTQAVTTGKRRRGRPKTAASKAPKKTKRRKPGCSVKDQTGLIPSSDDHSTALKSQSKQQECAASKKAGEEETDSAFHDTSKLPPDLGSVLTATSVPPGAGVEPTNLATGTEGGSESESETDCSASEVEYCPLTPQQKLVRSLARQRQLDEMRAREAAQEREERYLRRKGLLKPRQRGERRIQWKHEGDLVEMFLYSPVQESGDSPSTVLPS